MLRSVVGMHGDRQFCAGNECLVSALRDSALLHARSLHNFFLDRSPSHDDIVASDYLGSWDWWPDAELETLSLDVPDINKFRGHLTYTRTKRTRPWDLDLLLKEIEAAFAQFLARLPESERSAWQSKIDDPVWRPVRALG